MAAEGGDINRDVAERLRGVEHEENAVIRGDFSNGFGRLNRAGDVGGVNQCDEARLGRDSLSNGVGIDVAVAIARDVRRGNVALGQKSKRAKYRIVLANGGDDVIAWPQQSVQS